MKLLLSALLLVAVPLAFGQEYEPHNQLQKQGAAAIETATLGQAGGLQALELRSAAPSPDQTGCPVVLTQAHLNWPATYLPVTAAEKGTEPNLALGFQNSSGKAIRSVSITARFTGKASKYQLDATAFEMHLMFSGADSTNKTAEQLREIRLPEKRVAYGVTRVSLDEVAFDDGSFWTSVGHTNCAMNVGGSAERITK